jgi:hypothetical protein
MLFLFIYFLLELEVDNRIINWNTEVTNRFHSRLYALWNRKNGDCLLDSVLQVCLGVWDTENKLRRAMAETLQLGSNKYVRLVDNLVFSFLFTNTYVTVHSLTNLSIRTLVD